MYKQRFRRWGFRKNIRLHEVEDDVNYHELINDWSSRHNAEVLNSAVQLASGQVVEVDRLAAHLRRKMLYRRQMLKTFEPTYVKPPEKFYVCEAVLDDTRAYLVSAPKEVESERGIHTDPIWHNLEGPLPTSLHLHRRSRRPPRHSTRHAPMEPLLLPLPRCSRAPLALQPGAGAHATGPRRAPPATRE